MACVGSLRAVGEGSGGAFGAVWASVGMWSVVLGPSQLEDGCYGAPFFSPCNHLNKID